MKKKKKLLLCSNEDCGNIQRLDCALSIKKFKVGDWVKCVDSMFTLRKNGVYQIERLAKYKPMIYLMVGDGLNRYCIKRFIKYEGDTKAVRKIRRSH